MKRIGYDQISLDKDVVIDETDDEIIIRDVVIAREIVQPYDIDGEKKLAYKPGDELKTAAWTAERMRITMDQHPLTVVIDRVDLIHGYMADVHFVKNLKDMKTKRPMARGIRCDLHFFKKQISAQKQEDIKNLKHRDVSIGFFYDADETPGKWNGNDYDFVQRNICIDHLAGPIPKGRCGMPYCGIGADSNHLRLVGMDIEETEKFIHIPIIENTGQFETCRTTDFEGKLPEGVRAVYCKYKDEDEWAIQKYIFTKEDGWTMEKAKEWVKEHKGDNIMKDAILDYFSKYHSIKEKVGKLVKLQDTVSSDMNLEEINTKIQELRDQRKAIREKIDLLWKATPEEIEKNKEVNELYNQMYDIESELGAYLEAKVNKIAGNIDDDKPGDQKGEPKDNKERFMNHFDVTEEQVDTLLEILGEEIYKLLPERGQKKEQDEICETCANWTPCEDCETNEGHCSVFDKDFPADHECTTGEWKPRGDSDEAHDVDGFGTEKCKCVDAATEEELAAQKKRCAKYKTSPKPDHGGHITKPGRYENISEDMFADPCNYKYPMDAAHVMAAWAYVSKDGNQAKGGYSDAEWSWIKGRIEKRMEAEGHEIAEEDRAPIEETESLLKDRDLYEDA